MSINRFNSLLLKAMAAPPKPWERANVQAMVNDFTNFSTGSSGSVFDTGISSSSGQQSSLNHGPGFNSSPPPLPPRPPQLDHAPILSRYGNSLHPFSSPYSNPYGNYSPYMHDFGGGMWPNRYSSYGMMGGGYGQPGNNEFLRLAEENCGQAFRSLESVVQSVGSVSMMLESTYFAIYSSFRAVLGVAHHISTLKDHFVNIPHQVPLIRMVMKIIRKLLALFGLVSPYSNSGEHEAAWNEVLAGKKRSLNIRLGPDGKFSSMGAADFEGTSSLPIFIFFGIVFGAPWLIWTIVSRLTKESLQVKTKWSTGQDDHYLAQCLYPFRSESPSELTFEAGQKIRIAPKELQPRAGDWLLAASIDGKTGLVPVNYIKIVEFIRKPPDK